MPSIPMYAIRHNPTGMFLPAPAHEERVSNVTLAAPGLQPPRLFASVASAEYTANYWLSSQPSYNPDDLVVIQVELNLP